MRAQRRQFIDGIKLGGLVVCVLPLLVGCGPPINTGSMWAPNTFSRDNLGGTFAWAAFTGTPAGGPEVQDIREMVHETVANELRAKGYVEAPYDQASFWVATKIARSQQGDTSAQVPFEEYTEGNLYVYVVDPKTHQWIWRSWADTRLNPSNPPEEKRKRLREAIEKMFKSFPQASS